ncbi:MAG TPA: hypothetical protein VHB73_00670, partial [Alphaproteobacteria bacterium]|nr:hypothetical protein [Alphaproteobacteria bacterium]
SKVAAPIARDLLIEIQKSDPAKALPKPLVMPEGKPAPGATGPASAPPPEEDDDSQFNDYIETINPGPLGPPR